MNRRIVHNISYNFIIKMFTYFFSFVTAIYATRTLQPVAYGRVSFASNFTGYFLLVAHLGMPIYAMRLCAQKRDDRESLSRVFNELWCINICLSVTSLVIFVGIIPFVPKLRSNHMLLLVYGSSILFQMIGCDWLYRGLEKFRFLAISTLVFKTVSFVLILIFVHSPEHFLLYAVFSVLTAYGSNIFCFVTLRRCVDISFRFRINKSHFKPLIVFSIMSCAVSIYNSLDLTMLGFMKTDYETGLYGLVTKGKGMLTMLGGLVWSSVLPTATRLWKDNDRQRFESLAKKSLVAVMGIQLFVSVICIVFVKQIILIIGGEAYLDAVPAFRILMLTMVPIGASNILGGQVLIPAGKERCLLRGEVLGAAFNFIANLFVIPLFSIEGAAATTVISEIIVWVVCLHYIRKELGMKFGISFMVSLVVKLFRKIKSVLSKIVIRFRSKIYGPKLSFYCPCCDTYLKDFVDGGYTKKQDVYNVSRYIGMDQQVICPICRSLPRHRILVSWMGENRDWIKGKRVLHFAQEKSVKLWLDRNDVRYTTADLFNSADLKIDIQDTGLENGSFDFIICNHVMEHVSDYRRALAELSRILSDDGVVMISFPVDMSLDTVYEDPSVTSKEARLEHFGQQDHLRVFGADSREILQSFGFDVRDIRGENFDARIKPVIGPADYDYNVLWVLSFRR